jgi:hypothetical protein
MEALLFERSAPVLGVIDLRFGDGLDGRRRTASIAIVRPQLRQRAVRVDHGHKERPSRPDEALRSARRQRVAGRAGSALHRDDRIRGIGIAGTTTPLWWKRSCQGTA